MRDRMDTASAPQPSWFALPLLQLGVLGFAAAWTLAALALQRHCAWLAPLAAIDMALLLGFGRWPAGARRAGVTLLATLATIALANFAIAATEMGRNMGPMPWASALKLGPDYASLLIRLANGRFELACYAMAMVLALWAGLSGRRPAP